MGIKTIDRWLMGQLIFASVVAVVTFTGPVILISLSVQVPNEAVFSKLVWPALAGIAPMILYHSVPLLVPAAILWCYAEFTSNGTLLSLHMVGLSSTSVRAPAIAVAIAATAFGYVMSCWIAPRTAGNLQDVMMSLQHDMNPALLKTGYFNAVDGGRQVIFFRHKISSDTVADVFIREHPDTPQERVYRAKQAVFVHDPDAEEGIVLLDGTLQQFNGGDRTKLVATAFDRLALPVTAFMYGRSTHSYRLVEELGLVAFLRDRADAFKSPVEGRNWTREALKRFGVPAFALVHTLLGLSLLSMWSTMSGRRQNAIAPVCAILGFLHLGAVVLAEQASGALFWAGVFAAAVIAELTIAIVLMTVGRRRAWLSPAARSAPGASNDLHTGGVGQALWVTPDRWLPDTVAVPAANCGAQQMAKKLV